ncbi:DUF6339 family protein [Lentzea californiensis]|uniref:DUF6339 family protein n=1 Tax=Lentzea californiensis TaxID=438851 RepID=UPI002165B160|nr:DUF6339 family protein [Lentzea californiensis]MCR3749754.1 hypothetical protein [Lentzea californiensis]
MSRLYPRLLPWHAKALHNEYRDLDLPELTLRHDVTHLSAVFVATGGDRVGSAELTALRTKVVGLATEAGYPGASDQAARASFDLALAEMLHSEMGLVPAEAASGDVWAFLSLVLLPDVAYWRYPAPGPDRVQASDITRHVFGRLWWRAHLVHDPSEQDPYAALAILGEAAFDQIYARRKALGGSPYLVKAILRVWGGLERSGVSEREVLRDFLKRLLRLAPFMCFEAMEDSQLDAELVRAAHDSVLALREKKRRELEMAGV